MTQRTLIGVLVVLLVATAGIGAFAYIQASNSLHGTAFDPPQQAPEIRLTDQHNRTFRLSDQKGKIIMLYFGYTNCPDECPLTMAHLKQALDKLGTQARDIEVVMVTTDPARDDPQTLDDFMAKFDPDFVGLTGAETQLKPVWDSYSVVVEAGGETHSTFVYLIDQRGMIQRLYDLTVGSEAFTHDLKIFLRKG